MSHTIAVNLITNLAETFDSNTYPLPVYFDAIARVDAASTPDDLAHALYVGIDWKDAKARLTPNGEFATLLGDSRYGIAQIKPNTYSDRHQQVFRSAAFWSWARTVRSIRHFEPTLLDVLRDKFDLWDSVVIPAFVLHLLNPRLYPLIDRYVVGAASFLESGAADFHVNRAAYAAYERFWRGFLAEACLDRQVTGLHELKALDAGLWVFGKRLSNGLVFEDDNEEDAGGHTPPTTETHSARREWRAKSASGQVGTATSEFKMRAVELSRTRTQRDAMAEAASEFGIELPPSYLQYPGSHFDRWRKQGFA